MVNVGAERKTFFCLLLCWEEGKTKGGGKGDKKQLSSYSNSSPFIKKENAWNMS